ncbi:MAG TPA: putative baseplate assembly protein [Fimbriimonadaceae bacterium]|nr:putative baseplate assembly protein [Fimbriimonadaceae bacterium]
MSLPSPNLDTRNFQDIVDDAKRQIGLRCPEWTDHNVSDPGVTLIELFAYMTEMTLFRMNQVPEKNYIKFLEMIGLSLEMPDAARTDLRFRISRWIEDTDEGDGHELLLRGGRTIAGTIRTETEESLEFVTDADLRMVRPKMSFVVAVPKQDGVDGEKEARGAREFPKRALSDNEGFNIFSSLPQQSDAFYLGFENDISSNLVAVQAECLTAAATGLNEAYPAQVWEVWTGSEWERLEIEEDTTFGFNRSGTVELAFPRNVTERVVGGKRAYWARVRYTVDPADLPPKGIEQKSPDPYQKSPELTSIKARTIGGTAPSSHATLLRNEIVGISDGTPGQVFQLRHAPVLKLGGEETVVVGAISDDPNEVENWTRWERVNDFAESQPSDRHFTIDELTGEISFGPVIIQPDGSSRSHGAIPEKGLSIALTSYRIGGGVRGNVREHKIRVLKAAYPYISDVTNPRSATGGRDQETLERAKMRAKEILKVRNRAVTSEDYEFLAAKGSPGVGRARCVQPLTYPGSVSDITPGTVKVLIVPAMSRETIVPTPADLKVPGRTIDEVRQFLDERRLLTTVLDVGEPEYVYVSIDIKLVADPRADAESVAHRVQDQLNLYLHPLFGGPNGTGWPFRRTLSLADVYAQVGAVRGVAFLLDAKIFVSRLVNYDDNILGPESQVSNEEGVRLGDYELICSRQHNIRVVPMSAVGREDEVVTA